VGIQIERIQPGRRQQNGRHERMHLTRKREATKPASGLWRSWTTTWDTLTMRRFGSNRSRIRSARKCYPMSPE